MGGTFQATARFQDLNIFHKAIKVVLRYILSVNSHLSGFKLQPVSTHGTERYGSCSLIQDLNPQTSLFLVPLGQPIMFTQ